MEPEPILRILENLRGLNRIRLLEEEELTKIRAMELPENTGVSEALSREFTLVAVHDSSFRKPPAPTVLLESEGKIIGKENVMTGKFELEAGATEAEGTYLFPPVPFPELEGAAQNVVSASPSKEVHEYLMGLLWLGENPELATLLIGFDPKPQIANYL